MIPFKVSITLGKDDLARTFEIEGVTPALDGGNYLTNDKLGFAHCSNTLLSASKCFAEAGTWAAWEERARLQDLRRIPKVLM